MRCSSTSSVLLAAALVLAAACSGNNENSSTVDAGGTTIDAPLGSTADGGATDARPADARPADARLIDAPSGSGADAGQTLCASGTGPVPCACSDGLDNDHDGKTDAADPECTGPQDNDEATYATGIPGDNSDPFVQDCFFDGDSGGGNDGCRWDIRCTNPPGGQHCNNNKLEGCDKCKPLVPNGCDCFGCCDVYVSGVVHTVRIIEGCTAAVINDPVKCPVCTKVAECMNTCEPCEVCIGKPDPDPSCQGDAGVVNQCESPLTPCGPPDFTCPSEFTCITGCCQPFLD